jgi:hypothetical protein
MCAEHMLSQGPIVEERPDLLNTHGASGEANDPADIVWVNRGSATSDSDGFNSRFGAAAETARAVADAVIVAYERMIGSFNYATAGATYSLTVNMSSANSGFGASAGLNSQLGGKPKSGSISMGAGNGSTPNGTGNGWFLDPTPFESSEFQGSVVNAFAGDAQTGSPAAGKGDFYTVFAAELTHCIGLFGNSVAGWAARTTGTTVNDTAEGGGIGQFWIFNGPSITHLLSSNNGGGGGSSFNAAIHSAGPITTTIDGTTYVGAQDQGNAVYEFGRRYLVNNTFALMFRDAYNYASVDPARYGTMYSSLNQTSKQLLVRGGTGTSSDDVSITRIGNTLRVSVDVGSDVAGTGALPGAGNLPAFVSEYDISEVTSILVGTTDGNDTITLGSDLGVNVSVSGGNGTDSLVLQGDAGDNAFTYSGTTASAGTTRLLSIITTENVSFVGGDGNDTLTIAGTASAETFNLNAAGFSGSRVGTFATMERVLINTLGGADTVNINAPETSVLIDVGVSGDIININETLAGLPASLLATATGAANSTVTVNDATGAATLDVPQSLTIGSLTLRSGGTVAGAGDLTLAGASTWSGGTIGGAGALFVQASATLTLSGSDSKTLARKLRSEGLVDVSDGSVTVSAGLSVASPAIITAGLSIASPATLDITDNSLVVDYAGTSPISGLTTALTSGYNAGAWNGTGIVSSTIAATPGRTIGYGEATDIFSTFPATFAGANVDDTSVLIRITAPGDANLDGSVNFDDLLRLAQAYGTSARTFAQGNFNYDAAGNVDFDDLLLLAQHYGTTMVVAPPPTTSTLTKRSTARASVLS